MDVRRKGCSSFPKLPRVVLGIVLSFAARADGANLIANGDFSGGNAEFSSDYAFVAFAGCGNTKENEYTVGTNPATWNCAGNLVISVGDHTSGSGNMLIANGGNTSLRVWFTPAPIPVTPDTEYFFEAWILNWSTTSVGGNAARLTFRANGEDLLTASAEGLGVWTPVSAKWNSGSSTSVSLTLFNDTPTVQGNDFAVDDIWLDTVSSISTTTSTTFGCPGICGDANEDATISASDALIALRTAVGSSACPLCVCDVNQSASITAGDAQIILRRAVGHLVELNCPPG